MPIGEVMAEFPLDPQHQGPSVCVVVIVVVVVVGCCFLNFRDINACEYNFLNHMSVRKHHLVVNINGHFVVMIFLSQKRLFLTLFPCESRLSLQLVNNGWAAEDCWKGRAEVAREDDAEGLCSRNGLLVTWQLGKSSETTDEEYQEFVANFNKQQVLWCPLMLSQQPQTISERLYKDTRAYMKAIKSL